MHNFKSFFLPLSHLSCGFLQVKEEEEEEEEEEEWVEEEEEGVRG